MEGPKSASQERFSGDTRLGLQRSRVPTSTSMIQQQLMPGELARWLAGEGLMVKADSMFAEVAYYLLKCRKM
jgi:hypothetical protein